MSFSDFGRNSSRPAYSQPQNQRPAANSSAAASGSNNVRLALSQTSEALLQYQRNVGILEKIVQSLLARRGAAAMGGSFYEELQQQYRAQVDVLGQLHDKLQRQLTNNRSNQSSISDADKTAWIKLQRDFERVKSRADSLQASVLRHLQQQKQALLQNKNNQHLLDEDSETRDPQQAYEMQQQMQMQQDHLAEQIMREREEEIRGINRGMHQVNEIFKDLAHIVNSQQEQIDNIETQMEDSRVNAESGLQQVEKANEKYGSAQCTIS